VWDRGETAYAWERATSHLGQLASWYRIEMVEEVELITEESSDDMESSLRYVSGCCGTAGVA
jgi:hypothetical protein